MLSRILLLIVMILATTAPALAQYGSPVLTATPISAQEVELTWTWFNPFPVIANVEVRRAATEAELDTNYEVVGYAARTAYVFRDRTAVPNSDYWYRLAPYYWQLGQVIWRYPSNAAEASTAGQPFFSSQTPLAMTGFDFAQGLAWGDCDRDSLPDLYVTCNGGGAGAHNALVRNLGGGAFAKDSTSPLDDNGLGNGAAWCDIDNDHHPELAVTNSGGHADRLFMNDGTGHFSTELPGFDWTGPGLNMAWGDYDGDGDLDVLEVYLYNYGASETVHLRRNMGGAYLSTVTPAALSEERGCASVCWVDVDDDGDLDLYIVKGDNLGDTTNRPYRNDGAGVFTEMTGSALAFAGEHRGQAWGDYDNDGDLDVHVTGAGDPSRLLRNDGGWNFTEETAPDGYGTANAWIDYDNDGDLDLYVKREAGGSVSRLYRNDGAGGFTDVSIYPVSFSDGAGKGAAWGDYDRDGDLDLAVAAITNVQLIRNDIGQDQHWLAVALRGTASNAMGVGARVRVVADGSSQIREISGSSHYFSYHEPVAHFGLGQTATVDTLEITWPSGIVQTLVQGVLVDRYHSIRESDSGATDVTPAVPGNARIESAGPNPFNPTVNIAYRISHGSRVRLVVYDVAGRQVAVLVDGVRGPGVHDTTWSGRGFDGNALPSGAYFLRLTAGSDTDVRKITLLR